MTKVLAGVCGLQLLDFILVLWIKYEMCAVREGGNKRSLGRDVVEAVAVRVQPSLSASSPGQNPMQFLRQPIRGEIPPNEMTMMRTNYKRRCH